MLAAYTEDTPLRRVVKPAQAEALAKNKGLQTVGDLLEFVPRAYLPPNQLTDLGELREGEDVMVVAEVASVSVVLDLTFFSKHKYDFGLRAGLWGVFAGTVTRYGRRRQLTHPEMELLEEGLSAERADYLRTHQVPVYSATGKVTSFVLRTTMALVLDCGGDRIR